jgi:gluconokinase
MASATGVFDIRQCEWDRELLRYLKVKPQTLPSVVSSDSQTFRLKGSFAKRWPRLKDALWFPAIGDGAADNVGSQCVKKNKAALMVATSGAMRIAYAGEPPEQIPSGLWCYRIDRKRVIIGGALSDGGGLYQWLKANLKIKLSDAAIADEIARRGAAAHGLAFMPFVFGERSTGYHESAAGTVVGLRSSHDAIDILQAAMESVAYRFAEIHDQLECVFKISEIVASGGALREFPVWAQIIADVLGRDLMHQPPQESSSRGAVLLALESLGKIENIENAPAPIVETKAYHPKCHAIYKIARKRHREIYNAIINSNK